MTRRPLTIAGTLLLATSCVGRVPRAAVPSGSATPVRAALLTVQRPAGEGPWPVAVLLPGGRGAAEVGKAWPSYHRYAKRLAARGILAAVVDYARGDRGFWDEARMVELGAAIDEAHRLPGADPRRVMLVGFSMGGAYALMAAGSRSDIAGLVTLFAPVQFASLPEDKQPIAYVPRVRCPVLVLQGNADVITRPEQAERLIAALQESHRDGRLEIFRRQGHGFTYEGAPQGACCNFNEAATVRSVDLLVEFAARLRFRTIVSPAR